LAVSERGSSPPPPAPSSGRAFLIENFRPGHRCTTAMRTFEANQRMAQIHDDRIAKTISELGNIT
jgi:hypothetical protein